MARRGLGGQCAGRGRGAGGRCARSAWLKDAAVLIAEGRIVAVGSGREVLRNAVAAGSIVTEVIELDCRGKVVLPGFVDSHTHPAFVRPRLLDFERRVAGASYEEIADAGGGIRAEPGRCAGGQRSEAGRPCVCGAAAGAVAGNDHAGGEVRLWAGCGFGDQEPAGDSARGAAVDGNGGGDFSGGARGATGV